MLRERPVGGGEGDGDVLRPVLVALSTGHQLDIGLFRLNRRAAVRPRSLRPLRPPPLVSPPLIDRSIELAHRSTDPPARRDDAILDAARSERGRET